MEGNGTQRIFNLMGNGGQEGGLGIIKGAQSQILFLQKELLLVIFLQMKIENTAADNTYRDKRQKDICQSVCFRGKRSYSVREMVCNQTQSHIKEDLQQGNDQSASFFQHQHGKNNSKHKECRHAATITAAGKKHHRKNDQKDHDNGDQVAALIFSTVIGIKKKPSGDCNQRKIDQYISPGTGPETEKGHDQADHSTSQGEDVEQPDAEIKGGTE